MEDDFKIVLPEGGWEMTLSRRRGIRGVGGGGFLPTDLGNLELWLDAEKGITLNGADVSAWADQSGSGNDFDQTTDSKQPLFVASGINGRNSIEINTDTDELLRSNDYFTPSTGHAFLVCQPDGLAFEIPFGGTSSTGQKGISFKLRNDGDVGLAKGDGTSDIFRQTSAANLYAIDETILLTYKWTATNTNLRLNGLEVLADDSDAVDPGGGSESDEDFEIGAANNIEHYTGQVLEILLYGSNLSTAEEASVESYLAARAGITL